MGGILAGRTLNRERDTLWEPQKKRELYWKEFMRRLPWKGNSSVREYLRLVLAN